MKLPRCTTYILGLVFLHAAQVAEAQYLQDYIWQRIPGFNPTFSYRPLPAGSANPVIDFHTDPYKISVYLVYNCHYMKDICENARNFFATNRGQNMHPDSPYGLGARTFGYDFNSKGRSEKRGEHMCPDRSRGSNSWATTHTCPETNQNPVMRHDGQWFSTALEPGTLMYNIINRVSPNGNIIPSNIRYSCDEFPPKSFVEGGDGIGKSGPSETRCAAIRCSPAGVFPTVKAEQNWQGTAHQVLRIELLRLINLYPLRYPFFDPLNTVALFNLALIDSPNDGIAAKIWTYNNTLAQTVQTTRTVSQAKKRAESVDNSTIFTNQGMTIDELHEFMKAGHGKETLISAFDSPEDSSDIVSTASSMPQMEGIGTPKPWNIDDKLDNDNADHWKDQHTDDSRVLPRFGPTSNRNVARNIVSSSTTPLLKRATSDDLKEAQAIVKQALIEANKLNSLRLAQPLRNAYGVKRGADKTIQSNRLLAGNDSVPLFRITTKIADAAALVAEFDSVASGGNVTKRAVPVGSYWMGSLQRKGTVPWGNDPTYKVYRNVLDYGAVGDGITDDTKAIKSAMISGTRCGEKCNGSTTKNAIVYFPPGKYLISTTIAMPFGTQVIGDANVRPSLIASPKFIGLGVLSTDEYTGGAGGAEQYYINTANFYRQIRNIVVDITQAGANISALHYQVAQATSLQNVELIAKAGSTQIGMYAENGSGGQISDVTFTGGGIGLYGGNQQFTAQRLTFNGCTTGVQVIWDWGWVWKSIKMTNVKVGFKLVSDDGTGNIGSVSILDSSFKNVGTAVVIAPPSSVIGSGSTGVVLENVALSAVTTAVADTTGKSILAGSAAVIDHWVLGPVYKGSTTARSFSQGGKFGNYMRQATLVDSKGAYFERVRPQYEDRAAADFLHVKDLGCLGDGTTDDTVAFQKALHLSVGKILFVDAGSYILTSTILIPAGAKIVGETWSQLVASGSYFEDASKPQVLLKVGNVGDIGDVEMQDLLFTTRGATAGLILVQWNIAAATPGSAALWDCHARIGGATGTELTPAECPPVTSGINQKCSAASLMMHITLLASGYFENMWLWGADHMLDDPDLTSPSNEMIQTSIYIARGFLIESTKATWLYATASEHAVFYQYNFHGASNIFAGMIQTESPYFQPTPPPPAPFAAVVGLFPSDPAYACVSGNDFSGCDESWGVIITKSENIFIAGAGIYSWFSTYAQTCIDTQACQKALILLNSNKASVRIQNLITIGAKYMAVMDGSGITAVGNLNVKAHPFWSQITILDVQSTGRQFNDLIWLDPALWDMDRPRFTCVPPCNVKIPPWLGATSTVNYPFITVTSGTWTSVITQAPLTISRWAFDVVTLTQGTANKFKRQGFAPFVPVLATTSSWPSVMYIGGNGMTSTTAPTVPFPTPPATPLIGSFPKRNWEPVLGIMNDPTVAPCTYYDGSCVPDEVLSNMWNNFENFGNFEGMTSPEFSDPNDENWAESLVICPAINITTSSTTTTTTTAKTTTTTTFSTTIAEQPTQTLKEGNHASNTPSCYNWGQKTIHTRMVSAAHSFCSSLANTVMKNRFKREKEYSFEGTMAIKVSMEILYDTCQFVYNEATCMKYLSVPSDSCDCKGVNNKHGGTVSNDCYRWRIDPEWRP